MPVERVQTNPAHNSNYIIDFQRPTHQNTYSVVISVFSYCYLSASLIDPHLSEGCLWKWWCQVQMRFSARILLGTRKLVQQVGHDAQWTSIPKRHCAPEKMQFSRIFSAYLNTSYAQNTTPGQLVLLHKENSAVKENSSRNSISLFAKGHSHRCKQHSHETNLTRK